MTVLSGNILVRIPAELAETFDKPWYIKRNAMTVITTPKYNMFSQSIISTVEKVKFFAS